MGCWCWLTGMITSDGGRAPPGGADALLQKEVAEAEKGRKYFDMHIVQIRDEFFFMSPVL